MRSSTSWRVQAPCRSARRSFRRASGCSTRSRKKWRPSSRTPGSVPFRRRSGSPMPRIQVVPLLEVVRETPSTMTYRFRADLGGQPGQFLMVWIPRYDELPMALSYLGAVKGITVRDYGDATHALAAFTAGDRIGVRGPYGNVFRLEGQSVLAVGGGSGMGICDACSLDDKLVCVDGSIFTGEQLAGSEDFGHFRRDKSGRRIPA